MKDEKPYFLRDLPEVLAYHYDLGGVELDDLDYDLNFDDTEFYIDFPVVNQSPASVVITDSDDDEDRIRISKSIFVTFARSKSSESLNGLEQSEDLKNNVPVNTKGCCAVM